MFRFSRWMGAVATAGLVLTAAASDHKEAPLIQEDAAADIADVYAFTNPNDPQKLVLAMTVNPFSAPSEGIAFQFSPNVRYRFNIDIDFDALPDHSVDVTFGPREAARQTVSAVFPGNVVVEGEATLPTEEREPNEAIINEGPNGIKLFAGPRDDPFFFDVVGFFRFLSGHGSFTGSDGFAGYNVSAIVVEFPRSMIGVDRALSIWGDTARTRKTVRKSSNGKLEVHKGQYEQIERAGNPAVGTALIPFTMKDLFNIGLPVNDSGDFGEAIAESLKALGTNPENIAILASVAIPDTLKFDPASPAQYPNGRTLDDDVIDTLLFFIFNQQPVKDGVDANDRPFTDNFPYLALPHQPE